MNSIIVQRLIIDPGGVDLSGVPIPTIELNGPLQGPGGQPIEKIADIINIGISFLFPLAGILLFVFLVWGGFDYLLSSGDPEKIKKGQAKLTSSIIGFFLLVMAYFFTKLIARILGLGEGLF